MPSDDENEQGKKIGAVVASVIGLDYNLAFKNVVSLEETRKEGKIKHSTTAGVIKQEA